VIEWYPTKDQAKTPWMAGVTRDRKVESFNFEDNPHILLAGTTLSGKSNHLNQMISTIVNLNKPDEVRILLVDNKGGVEFTHWEGIKHALRPMIKKASDVLPTLRWIRELMERRLSTFEHVKAKNFMAYNAKVKDESKIPRLIVFIDELATLLGMDETGDIQNEFRAISSQGRAVGVHLVICTQHVSVDVLPGWIKTNMALRVSGFMPTDSASRVILDHGAAHTMPAIPGRMVFSVGTSWFYAQSPFITDDEIESAVKKSKDDPDPDNREFVSATPLTPKEKFSRQDMFAMALAEFGGKLTAKRMYERLGNNVISRGNLEKMVAEVIAGSPTITHCGEIYNVVKVRNWFEIQRAAEPPNENSDFPEESNSPESGKVGML
jgi:DNA segregation ATPase FtsK/SpoIIIE-like protein